MVFRAQWKIKSSERLPFSKMGTLPWTMYKNDAELIAGLKSGTHAAYEQLYREYFNMVKYLVMQNSGTAAQASDTFQDGIVVLFEKVQDPDFSIKASVKTYLYSICRNLWLKHLRDHKPTRELKDFEASVEVEMEQPEDPTEKQQRIINECLNKLGDPCKKLLTQFYYFRESMTSIASDMGYTNADNAKNQKYRCLKRLREMALALI